MTNEAILETLKVQPLTEEEKQSRHILKRLTGPIASCKEGTRNGRKYNRELWEQALGDDIFKEKVATKSLFLELGHPDREETDMTCACAVIPEMPKIVNDDLYAVVDVLDTPNGRLLNTLIDYGFVPGISSRGSGDVVGDEVDPETFFLETWDIVQTPALKKARLAVTEGIDKNVLNLKKALCESLESADEKDKKVMTEALHNLNIDVVSDDTKIDSTPLNEDVNIESTTTLKQTEENSVEAVDNGSESIIKSLQESLKSNAELEAKIMSLQEELAVRDAKVSKLEEDLSRSNSTIVRLTDLVKGSREKTEKISMLEEELKDKTQTIEKLLKRPIKESVSTVKPLKEEIAKKDDEIKSKADEINSLTEQLTTLKTDTENEIKSLKENLITEQKAHADEVKSLNESLTEKTKLIEKYDRLTESMANRYIALRAKQLGVKPEEITNKLGDRYSLKDVDNICEDLRAYKINVSKLPFVLDSNSVIKVNESKTILSKATSVNDDDYVDEDTYKIVNRL